MVRGRVFVEVRGDRLAQRPEPVRGFFLLARPAKPWSAVARHRPPSNWNDDADEPQNEVRQLAVIAAFWRLRGSLFQSNGGLRRAAALQVYFTGPSSSSRCGAIGWLKSRNQIADLCCSRPGVRWLDTALHPIGMTTPMNLKTRFANQHSSPRFSDFEDRYSK